MIPSWLRPLEAWLVEREALHRAWGAALKVDDGAQIIAAMERLRRSTPAVVVDREVEDLGDGYVVVRPHRGEWA